MWRSSTRWTSITSATSIIYLAYCSLVAMHARICIKSIRCPTERWARCGTRVRRPIWRVAWRCTRQQVTRLAVRNILYSICCMASAATRTHGVNWDVPHRYSTTLSRRVRLSRCWSSWPTAIFRRRLARVRPARDSACRRWCYQRRWREVSRRHSPTW